MICLKKVGAGIKQYDLFAIPVQLTYKGQRKFNTLLGGCCSIMMYLAIIIAFPLMITYEYQNPTLRQTTPKQKQLAYNSETNEFPEWEINTKQATFAVQPTY